MLEKLSESSGPVVGYKVVGKVTAGDYRQFEPEIQALVDETENYKSPTAQSLISQPKKGD